MWSQIQRLMAMLWLGLVCFEAMPLVVYQWTTTGESCTACAHHECACTVGKVPLEACCCAGMFASEAEDSSQTALRPMGSFCGDEDHVTTLLHLTPLVLPTQKGAGPPRPVRIQKALADHGRPCPRVLEPPDKVPIA